ncbi:hypothetical protein ASE14_06415 [Agromyces sp. Root81]|nr:hypothetical protein ASE14_06415 [Agromyces sp. Root81]
MDDLMALSTALDASPLDLLFPTEQIETGMGTGLPEYVTVDDLTAWGAGGASLELEPLRDHWSAVAAVREVEVEDTKRWREALSDPEARARAITQVRAAERLAREAEDRRSALTALLRERRR